MLSKLFNLIRQMVLFHRNSLILENGNFGIWYWNIKKKKYFVDLKNNDYFDFIYEQQKPDLEYFKSLLHPEDKEKYFLNLDRHLQSEKPRYESIYRLFANKKNEYVWIKSTGIIKRDKKGNPLLMAGTHADITDAKILEEKLQKAAYFDDLTGLPNYENLKLYFEQLDDSIKNNSRLVYFDISDFKSINSVYGYGVGDSLLISVREKIQKIFSNNNLVCRYHSDKFLVLVTDFKDNAELIKDLFSTYESIKQINVLGFKEIRLDLCTGIAKYKDDAISFPDLLRCSDIALNYCKKSKKSKKSDFNFFDIAMLKEIMYKNNIVYQLDTGLADGEFYMLYQPIVQIESMKMIGMEALVRWENGRHGNIPPNKFIDIAESSGQIAKLEYWILENIFSIFNRFEVLETKDSFISINLSTKGIINHDIEKLVIFLSEKYRVNLDKIQFEITETVLMEDISEKISEMDKMKKLGCTFALDDFGTGFSSLNYLDKLPVEKIKLDKELIDNIESSEKTKKLCENLITLAHNLNMKVIAEGVENQKQLEILKAMKCDCIQGYIFSKAISIHEINELRTFRL